MYGQRCVIFAHGYPIWMGRKHGTVDSMVERIRKWRRRTEGRLGDLMVSLKVPHDHVKHGGDVVDTVTLVWFVVGIPQLPEVVKL